MSMRRASTLARRLALSGLLCVAFVAQALFSTVAAHGAMADCGGVGEAASSLAPAHAESMAHHDHATASHADTGHVGHAMAFDLGDPAPDAASDACMACDAMAACGGMAAILDGEAPLPPAACVDHAAPPAPGGVGLVAGTGDRPPRLT
jgi:hypothetical protein